MKNNYFCPLPLLLSLLTTASLSCGTVRPKTPFDVAQTPPPPDYALLENWAAHPDKKDPADRTPCPDLTDEQNGAAVDVFFLHPTTYTGASRHQRNWNAAVDDTETNKKTDDGTILFQASIFNGAGRVFAPRYRQAHLTVFYGKDKTSAAQALDLAYADTKAAFEHYLKNWNEGRPFIIASHSQGARHAMFLLRDFVEGQPLQQQLVAAYLVGWPVREDFFKMLKPCRTPQETGCYCTWRTWNRDFALRKNWQVEKGIVCTNPLTWTTNEGQYAAKNLNLGGVVRPFCAVRPQLVDAEVRKGILLASKPKFPGSFFFRLKNYHIGDLNLYYMNVRENAQARVGAFLKR